MTYTETIESLRCCFGFGTCSECKAKSMMEEDPLPCKLDCKERLGLYAADLIERLTAENAEAEAERDAALADLADARSCKTCKYACDTRDCSSCKSKICKCRECHLDKNAWEWRGLPETPEEVEKA